MRSPKVHDQSDREGGGSQAGEGGVKIANKSISAGKTLNLCSYSLDSSLLSAAVLTQGTSQTQALASLQKYPHWVAQILSLLV